MLINYWSVIDLCETDSESAENLEAEVFNDVDHDHASFCKIVIDWSEIDQQTKEFVIWSQIELKSDWQQFSMTLITNLALSWL